MNNPDQLVALVQTWQRRARRKFADAKQEPDPMGKRLIEHGAVCYYNCAAELMELISSKPPTNIIEFASAASDL